LGMKTWLKINCLWKFFKRARAKLSILIEDFKISHLEEELEVLKFRLKSEHYEIILHKADYNLVKNGLI
jgi:hypothetical protein